MQSLLESMSALMDFFFNKKISKRTLLHGSPPKFLTITLSVCSSSAKGLRLCSCNHYIISLLLPMDDAIMYFGHPLRSLNNNLDMGFFFGRNDNYRCESIIGFCTELYVLMNSFSLLIFCSLPNFRFIFKPYVS